MAYILKQAYLGYNWIFGDLADSRPTELDLLLMSTPLKPILISLAYLYFCQNLGPRWMASRKPFSLKKTIIAFNISQIIINIHLFYVCFSELPESDWSCIPVDYSWNPRSLKELRYHHYYFLVKMSDFLDTIFFVLRKKNQQVTFLHLYHHFGMFLITWIDVKYFGGGHGIWLGILNCPVHAIMYLYYTLAIFDEKWKTNATFKKFLTQLQMVQFLALIIIYGRPLFMAECRYPKIVCYFFVPQNFFMLVLFLDFYRKCYLRRNKSNGSLKSNGLSESG
ncbi:unnamed protein product [Phaedon cochleariae]|uniref:Elongation of very long chain fatty acids protein n=1 Tax=Phaedon cochleariae TaxID=80249 RepID=A0A9P0GLN2_PHACE|nr:unnamed protein product [Phaedon cochleariae]